MNQETSIPRTPTGPPSGDAAASPVSSRRVLVADDDPVNRRLAGMILSRAGHEATVVESGEEALAALCRTRFDLILLDVEMPGLSGPETAAVIRREHKAAPGHCTVILALTGHCGPEEHACCLESGMDAVLVKPLSLEALAPWLPTRQHADA